MLKNYLKIALRNIRNKKFYSLLNLLGLSEQLNLAVLIHLFTRNPDYGEKDAAIFVNDILADAPNLTVQIAHLGGAGAFNETTSEVIEYFENASTEKPNLIDKDLFFDLSVTVLNPEVAMARGDTTRAEEIRMNNKAVAQKLVTLNSNRLLFGTDWIAVSRKPNDYSALFKSLPIQPSLLKEIFENEAPYFKEIKTD